MDSRTQIQTSHTGGKMSKQTGTQSIERAISILKTFSRDEPELGVTEIGNRLGLHKSTAHRLVGALEREGLLSQDPRSGRYRLGLGLLSLAGQVRVNWALIRAARPMLELLSGQTRETASLSVLDGRESINLDRALPPGRQIVSHAWVGRRAPAHAVSTGKVLLASLPENDLERFLARPLDALTNHTIVDPAALKQELKQIRSLGYATGIQEFELGLSAISAPLRDQYGIVVAAIAVSGPSSRISVSSIPELARAVMSAAEEISRALGCGDAE